MFQIFPGNFFPFLCFSILGANSRLNISLGDHDSESRLVLQHVFKNLFIGEGEGGREGARDPTQWFTQPNALNIEDRVGLKPKPGAGSQSRFPIQVEGLQYPEFSLAGSYSQELGLGLEL